MSAVGGVVVKNEGNVFDPVIGTTQAPASTIVKMDMTASRPDGFPWLRIETGSSDERGWLCPETVQFSNMLVVVWLKTTK